MKRKLVMMMVLAAALTLGACGKETAENTDSTTENTETDASGTGVAYEAPLYEDLTSKLVNLAEYKGVEAEKTVAEVTDEDVQAEIDSIQKENAELVDKTEPAETGDVVNIDFTGYINGETSDNLKGEGTDVEIGAGTMLPDFENQLVGVTTGEDTQISFTFPEDYNQEVAGKDVQFDIHVNSVQAYDLPELTDEYVQENTDYDSIEDMQASIREELEQNAQSDADDNWQYSLIKQVLDNSEFEIEDADVKAYTDEMLTEYQTYANMYGMEMEEFLQSQMGVTEEQLREAYRETATFRVKMTLAFHAIAEQEGLTVSDEEYQDRLSTLASQYGYDDPSQIEQVYAPELIKEQIIQEKAIDLIAENGKVISE